MWVWRAATAKHRDMDKQETYLLHADCRQHRRDRPVERGVGIRRLLQQPAHHALARRARLLDAGEGLEHIRVAVSRLERVDQRRVIASHLLLLRGHPHLLGQRLHDHLSARERAWGSIRRKRQRRAKAVGGVRTAAAPP